MNSYKQLQSVIFGLLIVLFSISGCASLNSLPTVTPYPTYTPYPTFTPSPPTATPIPERWSVKVISTIKAQKFGVWTFPDPKQKAEFVIITIEYTNKGQDAIEFSPQSVVLLFPEGSSFPGTAFAATHYQSEANSTVTNFANDAAILFSVKPGQTKTEKFGWALTSQGDTKYSLLFPETKPIDITVGN